MYQRNQAEEDIYQQQRATIERLVPLMKEGIPGFTVTIEVADLLKGLDDYWNRYSTLDASTQARGPDIRFAPEDGDWGVPQYFASINEMMSLGEQAFSVFVRERLRFCQFTRR